MRAFRFFIFVLLLFSQKVDGQKVELLLDTITIITIKQIDASTGKAIDATRLLSYDNKLYVANNIPFAALKVQCDTITKSTLYYEEYSSITNKEALRKFLRKIDKNIFYRSDSYKEKATNAKLFPEVLTIIDCLQRQESNMYLVNCVKGLGTFFFLNCGYNKGVHDYFFCEEKLTLDSVPVLLNIKGLSKKAK